MAAALMPHRLAQLTLRALWFVVIPAELAALTLRFLVPSPGASEGVLGWVARQGHTSPLALGAGLFLLFVALARYWCLAVPGGVYLSPLPLHIAERVGRARWRAYLQAAELRDLLVGRSMRGVLARKLTNDQRPALEVQLGELSGALEGDDLERVNQAAKEVRSLAAPAVSSHQRRQHLVFAAGVLAAATCAMLLRATLVESYQVSSTSMLPTLDAGDRILANKTAYGLRFPFGRVASTQRVPRRAELVVFTNTTGDGPDHLVKRVIGLPGDRVAMRGDHPIINGWEIPSCDAGTYVYPFVDGTFTGRLRVEFLDDEAYLTVQTGLKVTLREPYVVQAGEAFVMGDNRSYSSDSRTWNEGKGRGVAFDLLVGRAERFLVSTRRDGRADFTRLFRPFGHQLHVDGVDVRSVEQGIERCLSSRPASTRPPQPEATTPVQQSSIAGGGKPL